MAIRTRDVAIAARMLTRIITLRSVDGGRSRETRAACGVLKHGKRDMLQVTFNIYWHEGQRSPITAWVPYAGCVLAAHNLVCDCDALGLLTLDPDTFTVSHTLTGRTLKQHETLFPTLADAMRFLELCEPQNPHWFCCSREPADAQAHAVCFDLYKSARKKFKRAG